MDSVEKKFTKQPCPRCKGDRDALDRASNMYLRCPACDGTGEAPAAKFDVETLTPEERELLGRTLLGGCVRLELTLPPRLVDDIRRAIRHALATIDATNEQLDRAIVGHQETYKLAVERGVALAAANEEIRMLRVGWKDHVIALALVRKELDDVCALYARDCAGLVDSRVALIRERNRR